MFVLPYFLSNEIAPCSTCLAMLCYSSAALKWREGESCIFSLLVVSICQTPTQVPSTFQIPLGIYVRQVNSREEFSICVNLCLFCAFSASPLALCSGNNIGDEGAWAIASSLTALTALTGLELSYYPNIQSFFILKRPQICPECLLQGLVEIYA